MIALGTVISFLSTQLLVLSHYVIVEHGHLAYSDVIQFSLESEDLCEISEYFHLSYTEREFGSDSILTYYFSEKVIQINRPFWYVNFEICFIRERGPPERIQG